MSRANQLRQSIEAALSSNPIRIGAGLEPAGVHSSTCDPDGQFLPEIVKQEVEKEGEGMRPQQEACVEQEHREVKQRQGEEAIPDSVEGVQTRCPSLDVVNHNHLRIDDLRPHFFKSREEAAQCLRVSMNSLKAACRRNGVDRWPYRKLLSLVNLTEAMKGKATEEDLAEMQAELSNVVANPNHEVNENMVKMKLMNYKERYRRRTKGGTQPIKSRRSKQKGGKNRGGVSMKRTGRKCQQPSPSSSLSPNLRDCPSDPLTRDSSFTAPGWPTQDEGTLASTRLLASASGSDRHECVGGQNMSSVSAQFIEQSPFLFAHDGSYSGVDATAYVTSGLCGADARSKGGSASHQQQQEQQEQQQQQQQLMLCSGPLAPPPPELSSRKGSSQQVLEHQHHQGSALDACPPVLTPMPPSAASHAHPRHLQPSLSVGGLVTVEQLHPQPTADHRVPPHPRATPSARSSSTIIAADVAQPLPLQQPLQPSQCLAAPWQQQQRSGSGSPTPQPGPLPTVRPRTSFDFAVWFGAADCHSSGSISPHGDCVGSGAASGYARSATAPLMLVGSLSKPRPQPSPAGHTFMHMFDEPIAACAAIQEQQQQQQAPLSHTLLHTQPVVRMPRCKVQQLQQRHPQASPVHHPWTDHTLKDPGATQEAPGGAGLHPLPPLAAEPGVETARACAEAGRGDAQEILPATASISTLPSSCGLASIGFHCNDDIADTHVGAGHGDVVHDVNVAHPRMEPLSLHFEQQPHPFAQQQHQQEHHRHLQQQQQQQQGQQPPHFGGHSLQHELHSSSNVPVDPSLFLLQENEEGGQLRDCSLPSMPASAAQFAARLSDLRTASPPSILMDRFHSSSFPGHTPSLQGLADLPRHHQEQQQEQQQRQQGDPEQLDDLLEALDGFQEPPGLSDFNSAPLPRLPSLDHDMDSVFESVVRSGLW